MALLAAALLLPTAALAGAPLAADPALDLTAAPLALPATGGCAGAVDTASPLPAAEAHLDAALRAASPSLQPDVAAAQAAVDAAAALLAGAAPEDAPATLASALVAATTAVENAQAAAANEASPALRHLDAAAQALDEATAALASLAQPAIGVPGDPMEAARLVLGSGPVTVWTSMNDGEGSCLDADLLDGLTSSDFLDRISDEAAARAAADAALQANLDAIHLDLDAALADLRTADAALDTAIKGLRTDLSAEITARQAAIDALQTSLNALDASMEAETATREAADAALRADLDTESASREAADAALDTRATALEAHVNGGAFEGATLDLTGDASVGGDLALAGTLTAGTVPWARITDAPSLATEKGLTGGGALGAAPLGLDVTDLAACTSPGDKVVWDAAAARLACAADVDTDTTYDAGAGLALDGTTFLVADGGIGAASLANGAVTGPKLAAGAVGTDALAAAAVTGAILADGSVDAAKVDPSAIQLRVTDACPADGAIRSIAQDGTVTCFADAGGTVTSIQAGAGLAGGPITTTGTLRIADGGVTNAMLEHNTIRIGTGHGIAGGGTAALGQTVTIGIAPGGVTTDRLADAAVTSAKIADGTITAADIDATSVQRRVTGSCAGSRALASIAQDGTVGCNAVWGIEGNAATTPGTHFLGTTDAQPLDFRVNNERGLRISPASVPNIIGGAQANAVGANVAGATIAGGGDSGLPHSVHDSHGTVGGGLNNLAGSNDGNPGNAPFATVAGGNGNSATAREATVGGGFGNVANRASATVAGGWANTASGDNAAVGGGADNYAIGGWSAIGGGASNRARGDFAAVAGGDRNTASGSHAVVAGGEINHASDRYSAVGGGGFNQASGIASAVAGGISNIASGPFAMVPGGRSNTASGTASLAAGDNAKANHDGAFVWSDRQGSSFASTGANQFLVRAAGGAAINTNTPVAGAALTVAGTIASTSGGVRFPDATTQTTAAPRIARGAVNADGTLQYNNGIVSVDHTGLGAYSIQLGMASAPIPTIMPIGNVHVAGAWLFCNGGGCGFTVQFRSPTLDPTDAHFTFLAVPSA